MAAQLATEHAGGVADRARYTQFAEQVAAIRTALRQQLTDLRAQGKRIAAYGASAKGSTLLNYCGIGPKDLDAVVDKSSYKHGKFTAGTDLPIVAPEDGFKTPPDRVVLLAWNFTDEILDDMEKQFGWKGPVLLPLPGDPKWIRNP